MATEPPDPFEEEVPTAAGAAPSTTSVARTEAWHYETAHDLGLPWGARTKSLRRESGLIECAARRAWWTAVRAYLRVVHRWQVTGVERLPVVPPFVVVANHASHLDALALVAMLPRRWWNRAFPVAAGDTFFQRPALATFSAALINALPMWRRSGGAHAISELRRRLLEEECIYVVFPEGTRTRTGKLGTFRPGLGMLVAGTTVPVVCCRINGTFEAWPAGQRLPRPRRIAVRIGPVMTFESAANTREGWDEVVRALQAWVEGLGNATIRR